MTDPSEGPELEALLGYLQQHRGFDFGAYKRSSLARRIRKRMLMVGIRDYTDYTDYLEVHPEEFEQLFNTILINVTSFFRDSAHWEYLRQELIPQILAGKGPDALVRVWSAGCSSGEEAYSLAILLSEAIGIQQTRERVKIYATDVDEEALSQARQASYPAKAAKDVPPEFLERYFERNSDRYLLDKELRRCVIFGRHDLLQDAPISHIDLLVCRNTLMYFNAEAQARILARFHFSLNDGGYLFLGKAEMLLTHGNTFTPVDLKRRVFSRVPRVNLRDRLLMVNQGDTGRDNEVNHLVNQVYMTEVAFDIDPVAQIVVDLNGVVILVNQSARQMLGLSSANLGRPFQELEMADSPLPLRSYVDRVQATRRPVVAKEAEWPGGGRERTWLDLQVLPLLDANGNMLGVKILFSDVTKFRQLQEDLRHANQELETAYEELQTTNEELQSSNEELETTNEELQSSNEELETTNEELQSSNEELETMNEELQSTNEELEALNVELRQRSDELNDSNALLQSILTSLNAAVVVVDRELHVLIWCEKAEDMWGLRTDEAIGKNFLNLDIGLPVEQLRRPIRACLSQESECADVTVRATNRRGRGFDCRVVNTPLVGPKRDIRGVILQMHEA